MKSILLVIAAVLLFSCSGGGGSAYQRALGEQDALRARALYLEAIARDDHAAEAHYRSALLLEQSPEDSCRLVWHLSEFLRLSPQLPASEKREAEEWLGRAEKRLSAILSSRLDDTSQEESRLRLKLLEEHALRQKQWIQELMAENQKLRQLSSDN